MKFSCPISIKNCGFSFRLTYKLLIGGCHNVFLTFMIVIGWTRMQNSEKQHPPLGQTRKHPTLQESLDFERIVAPLASFDTIDLGDDDLTPTDEVQPISSHTCAPSSANKKLTGSSCCQVTRPSDLRNLHAKQGIPQDCELQDQDLTPTTEQATPSKLVDKFCTSSSQNTSKSHGDEGLINSDTTRDTSLPSVNYIKRGVENVSNAVDCPKASMSNTAPQAAEAKAKENKKPKKQRKRTNSSSSSEWSDDETSKGSAGVSWSRRVHIYGRINKSPTPSSPRLSLPPPPKETFPKDSSIETVEIVDLSKASASKRKAYLKKLQRLQVKTNPIERPRSTTPINIFTLDEYVHYSSPEASPGADKIKIKLPDEEFSPRNAEKDNLCFNFNEEDLFSHTRSGILVTNDAQVPTNPQSPRRVLIPPSLTPTSSPSRSAASSPRSPRYIYCPSTNTHFQYPGEVGEHQPAVSGLVFNNNWVKFEDSSSAGKTLRSLSETKPQSQPVTLPASTKPKSPQNLSEDTEEILEVRVVEDGSAKRDCSIKILPADTSQSAPILESKVPNVATAIASALKNTDDDVEDDKTESPCPAADESSAVKEANCQKVRHSVVLMNTYSSTKK